MIALITQREQKDSYGTPIDVLESDYICFFENLGVKVRAISNFTKDVESFFETMKVDFIILTGGGSVPNEYYKYLADEPQQTNRDKVEKTLLEECVRRGIPVLGICRGMQFINGFFGGKVEKLSSLSVPRPNGKEHSVYSEFLQKTYMVNNFHNDGIMLDGLAEGMKPFAVDTDNGVVEAFYSDEKKILALQWHPERPFESEKDKEESKNIIMNFINKYIKEHGI